MVGLGTYKIVGQDTVTVAVDAALKAGYRLFDTAKYYLNEPELGIALQVSFFFVFIFVHNLLCTHISLSFDLQ